MSPLPLPSRSMGLWRRCRFCRKRMTVSSLGLLSKHLLMVNEAKYVLFTFPMSFTPAKGNLYHTGGECNIQRVACFVQLQSHNPLVFYSIIAAPYFIGQDNNIIKSFSWVSSPSPATTLAPHLPAHKVISQSDLPEGETDPYACTHGKAAPFFEQYPCRCFEKYVCRSLREQIWSSYVNLEMIFKNWSYYPW